MIFRFLASVLLASAMAYPQTEQPRFEQFDPAFKRLFPPGAMLQTLATGFKWTEGPVWTRQNFLLFAEIPSNTIRTLMPDGKVAIWMQPSGYKGLVPYGGPEPGSNGMTLDASGRLNVAGHALRNVWRLETLDPHGQITVLADNYQGKKLNSPNDLVYGSDGSLYFTDPPYGNRTQSDKDPEKELPFNGVYRLRGASAQKPGSSPDASKLELLVKDLPRPNGVAFSPDEKTLYVNNSEPKFWMKYPVESDGKLGTGTKLFDASDDKRKGAPDGMRVDTEGNLWTTGPGGIWVFSPSGKHLGTLLLDEAAGNLTFGERDGKTLFITNSGVVRKIRVNNRGFDPSRR